MTNAELKPDSNTLLPWVKKQIRLLVRCACLIAALICLSTILTGDMLIRYVPALSPFVALSSLLATKTIQPIMALGLLIGVIALVRRRWFCRWLCPVGLCADCASSLGRRMKRKPAQGARIGQWIAVLTLGGAILGYPLFLWLDPLAFLSGFFLITAPAAINLAWLSTLPFALLLIASALWPDLWCSRLCPLGGLQDILSVVPRHGRSLVAGQERKPDDNATGYRLARRTALGLALGATCAAAARKISRNQPPLRPPGAVEEPTFVGLCTRCGNCIRACPYTIIRRDAGAQGWTGLLAPTLAFENDYCREDCTRCTRVCPSGALAPVFKEQKCELRIGLPRVDMDVCLLAEDRECSACMRWCPYEAIRYVFSEASYSLTPVINPDKCNGCGACEKACPTKPAKAIRVIALLSS
ncbi:MAG: 4Fe-4S dicluster domain-containing protein [Planctomycetota bacterium]